MDFAGRYLIAAPPQKVWDAVLDPEVLKACIPGCEQLERSSPTEYVATAKLKIGPISATFKGKVTLSDLNPPHSCRLSGEGQGGVAGFAKGAANVALTPEGAATMLSYTATANVGGKLAQIGQRLVDGAAKQIADDFFKRFSALVGPELPPDPTTADIVATLHPPHATAEIVAEAPPPRTGLSPAVWVTGLIAVIAVLLLAFGLRA